jgi:GTP-binding protein HflX
MNNGSSISQSCILLGVNLSKSERESDESSLDELALLAETAGYVPLLKILQKRDRIDAACYIGRGKGQELRRIAGEVNADTVIFDFELTPVQIRNLERLIKRRVIIRTELILNIFGNRAHTKEAKLQVELATLLYSLPRLRHMWTHLNRVSGHLGTKGPGEKQLENDRRRIQKRISKIKKDLVSVQTHRKVIRKNRQTKNKVALVGYTNAGKSSLLNTLSHSSLFTENRLFATLDPATREVWLGDGITALVTDTVGFLKRLPHSLIASFRATLEEVHEADLLLHVVDIGSPDVRERIEAVKDVLGEISAHRLPVIYVFNKVDVLERRDLKASLLSAYRENVVVSAKTGEGIAELRNRLFDFFSECGHVRETLLRQRSGERGSERVEFVR